MFFVFFAFVNAPFTARRIAHTCEPPLTDDRSIPSQKKRRKKYMRSDGIVHVYLVASGGVSAKLR